MKYYLILKTTYILEIESILFAARLKESDTGIKEIIYDYYGFSLTYDLWD